MKFFFRLCFGVEADETKQTDSIHTDTATVSEAAIHNDESKPTDTENVC